MIGRLDECEFNYLIFIFRIKNFILIYNEYNFFISFLHNKYNLLFRTV